MTNPTQIERIVSTPGVCGGRPCIAGTRIRVQDVYVLHELQGLSAEEIVGQFPGISMADVYAALAWFWDHRGEVQRQMDEEHAFVERMIRKHPSVLGDRLGRTDGSHPPVSS